MKPKKRINMDRPGSSSKKSSPASKNTPKATPPSANGEGIKLTEEEAGTIRRFENAIVNQKAAIADLHLRIKEVQAQIDKGYTDVDAMQQAMLNKAKEIAKGHGIDLDKEEMGHWNLDTTTMILTRTS